MFYSVNGDRHISPAKKTHVVGEIKINTAIVSQTCKVGYNNNNRDFVKQQCLRKFSDLNWLVFHDCFICNDYWAIKYVKTNKP